MTDLLLKGGSLEVRHGTFFSSFEWKKVLAPRIVLITV